jgi:hypothetical protein
MADVPLLPFKIGGAHTFYANRFVEVAGQRVRIPDGMDVKGVNANREEMTAHFADPGVQLTDFNMNVLKSSDIELVWSNPPRSSFSLGVGLKGLRRFESVKYVSNPSLSFTQKRLLYFRPAPLAPYQVVIYNTRDTETMMIPDGMQPVPRVKIFGVVKPSAFSYAVGENYPRRTRKFDADWLYNNGISVLTDAQIAEARSLQSSNEYTFNEGKYVRVGLMRIPDGMTIKNNKIPIMVSDGTVAFDMDFDEAVLGRDGVELSRDSRRVVPSSYSFAQNRYIAISKPGGFYGMRIPDDTRAKMHGADVDVLFVGPGTAMEIRPYNAKLINDYYDLVPDTTSAQKQIDAKEHFKQLREMLKTLPDTSADKIDINESTEWMNRLSFKAEVCKGFLVEGSTDKMQVYYKQVHEVTGQVVEIFRTRIAEVIALRAPGALEEKMRNMSTRDIEDKFMGIGGTKTAKKQGAKKATKTAAKNPAATKNAAKKPAAAKKVASKKK